MLRCQHCQFDNQSDALACARCGHALPRATTAPSAGSEAKLPDWLQAIDMSQAKAGPEPESDHLNHHANNTDLVGAVAAAAALPVHVRRSRVPLVVADRPLTPASESELSLPLDQPGAGAAKDSKAGPKPSNRRLVVLVAILVVLLLVLAYFILER